MCCLPIVVSIGYRGPNGRLYLSGRALYVLLWRFFNTSVVSSKTVILVSSEDACIVVVLVIGALDLEESADLVSN